MTRESEGFHPPPPGTAPPLTALKNNTHTGFVDMYWRSFGIGLFRCDLHASQCALKSNRTVIVKGMKDAVL
jgi:hypothetical protein